MGRHNVTIFFFSFQSDQRFRLLKEIICFLKSLTTTKRTTKFSSANFEKNVKSKLYHTENYNTGGQTV